MKKKKVRIIILLFMIGIIISYKTFKQKVISNEDIVNIIINNTFQKKPIYKRMISSKNTLNKSLRLLNDDYIEITEDPIKKNKPMIYLYNSHPTEEYSPSSIGEYLLNPTVIMSNYILEDIFNKNGYQTIVEEKSVKDILNENNMSYASSYIASRSLMEEKKAIYPTLEYFIDIHRDSLEHTRTSVTINDRNYAKVLFIVGLENPNYQSNLEFTEKINKKIDEYYPGLSKGIYKKEGPGVNGVYNQDFSPHTILIEIGGYENTTVEVLNTAIAFSKCFLEVLNEEIN